MPLIRVTFPRSRGLVGTELPAMVLMNVLSRGVSVLLLLWHRPLTTGLWNLSLPVALPSVGTRLLLLLYRPTSGKAGTLRFLRCRMRNGQCYVRLGLLCYAEVWAMMTVVDGYRVLHLW